MKLRSRTKTPTSNSPSVTATRPILPANITRLQTPPISELSNAGSTITRRERLSELSSSNMDVSDTEETIPSVTPTKSRSKPTMTAPAAPLTTKNLAMHQEEITSAVEHAPEDGPSSTPPTSNTRLTQARNYLLTKNTTSDPEYQKEYLHSHRHAKGCEELLKLIEHHSSHAAASKEPTPRQSPPAAKDSSRSKIAFPAEDYQDPQEKADPFEWTNKLGDLTKKMKLNPSGRKEAFAVTNLQELARPLNGGRLPSPVQAYDLIDEQMSKEFHEDKTVNDAVREGLWDFEKDSTPVSSSSDNQSPEEATAPALKLGEGKFMPREMKDVVWDRDRSKLEENLVGYEDVHKGEAQLLLAETPLLQALMSEQIESDLAAKVKKGQTIEPVKRRPAVPMTQKFALPRPAQYRIDESAAIARSLNIRPDPPGLSPRTAKREFERESDDEMVEEDEEEMEEEEEEEEEDSSESESPVGRAVAGVQGERVYVDDRVSARNVQFDGSVGGSMMMSGALQDP